MDIDQVARSMIADLTLSIGQSQAAQNVITTTPIGYSINSANTSAVGVASDIYGGGSTKVLALNGKPSANVNYTLPSVASIAALIPAATPGQTWQLRILNLGPITWTILSPDSTWNLNGTMTIATATFRDFIVQYLSPTLMSLTDMGSGVTVAFNFPFWTINSFPPEELQLCLQPPTSIPISQVNQTCMLNAVNGLFQNLGNG